MKKTIILIPLMFTLLFPVKSFSGTTSPDEVFKIIAEELSEVKKKLPNKTVAIYGFEVIGRPNDSYGKFATEKLTHEIVKLGDLIVIERSRIDQVIKEQSLSTTGAVDANTAAKIGRILSVDAVIIGTIHVKGGEAEFIARVIQSEKGMILASSNEKINTASADKNEESTQDSSNDFTDDTSADNQKNSAFIVKPGKTIYTRFEQITINYSGLPGNQSDWITLSQASQGDDTYGEWFYTSGQKSGSHTFTVKEPGDYEIRVYYNWPAGGYVVQKRIKIKVK